MDQPLPPQHVPLIVQQAMDPRPYVQRLAFKLLLPAHRSSSWLHKAITQTLLGDDPLSKAMAMQLVYRVGLEGILRQKEPLTQLLHSDEPTIRALAEGALSYLDEERCRQHQPPETG
jgi:hypothetical protein